MYQVIRTRKAIANGENFLYPDITAISLFERLYDCGIDIKNPKVVKALLSLLTLEQILSSPRINKIVEHRAKSRQRTHHFKNLNDFALANMHTVLLMDKRLFDSVAQLPNSPLRGLTSVQVSALCGAWIHLKLHDIVFTASNLMLWVGCSLKTCKDAIYLLVNLGYLQSHDYKEVFARSGKLPANKLSAYYSISHEGEKVLKAYFKVFIAKFEKLTKESWDIPLLEMIKGDSDFVESTGKKIYNKKER